MIGEIKKYVTVSKATGPNSIPVSILKHFNEELILINKSLDEDIFSDILKLASVCPIYKENEQTKCANFRPISLF